MFKLAPNATFEIVVEIPVPGENEPGKLRMTAKHFTLEAHGDWLTEHQERLALVEGNSAGFDEMAAGVAHLFTGWGLPDKFTEANVRQLLVNYGKAYAAIMATYSAELMGFRAKN